MSFRRCRRGCQFLRRFRKSISSSSRTVDPLTVFSSHAIISFILPQWGYLSRLRLRDSVSLRPESTTRDSLLSYLCKLSAKNVLTWLSGAIRRNPSEGRAPSFSTVLLFPAFLVEQLNIFFHGRAQIAIWPRDRDLRDLPRHARAVKHDLMDSLWPCIFDFA